MDYFVVGNARLAYRIAGPDNAPVLVLLNSLGTDLRMWDPQIALLSQKLRVLRYDCRGHGMSDVSDTPYTLERLGLDLLALLDMLEIPRAHICGLSLGGMIAQWVALYHPTRVERVVLANTAARIGSEAIWNARIEAVRIGGMAAVQDAVLGRFLSQKFRTQEPEKAALIREMIGATNPEGYTGACAALREADFSAILSTIRVPVLIVGSELDESTPVVQARELHEAIGGSELVVFPGVAHLSNVERPQEFGERLVNFLTPH